MKILFDIGHPAHVHLFKYSILQLKNNGHIVLITIKDEPIIRKLLDHYKFEYILIGKKGKGNIQKGFKQVWFTLNILYIFWKNKIDLAVGVSISIAQASLFVKTKSMVFDDDDTTATPVFAALSHTFANHVFSPASLRNTRKRAKDIFHDSFHELAYLYPTRFSPDKGILKMFGINADDYYSIIRFSALKAHHDIGERGINHEQASIIIRRLEKKGKVLITSENELPVEYKKYQLKINPSHFHDVLAFANILVCDSQTVAAEAAVLGVPSVRINSFVGRISYLEELEYKHRLTFGFNPENFNQAIEKIQTLISDSKSYEIFQKRRRKMLSEKIDLTAFIIRFIENYPHSAEELKSNLEYKNNLR